MGSLRQAKPPLSMSIGLGRNIVSEVLHPIEKIRFAIYLDLLIGALPAATRKALTALTATLFPK